MRFRRVASLGWRGGTQALTWFRRADVLLVSGSALLVLGVVAGVQQYGDRHGAALPAPVAGVQADRVRLALTEDKLVPPPPLPPSAFVDAIAQAPSLRLDKADRDWGKLNPDFAQLVLRLAKRMEARGFPMTLLEGYRSPERQDMLAAKGPNVTRARGGQSRHQLGLAVDLAPVRDGKVVISERDPWAMQAYQALGEEAAASGLTWGGNWSFKDYGHIEQRKGTSPAHK